MLFTRKVATKSVSRTYVSYYVIEMFYLNTIEQLFLFVEQLDQLEVCLPFSGLFKPFYVKIQFWGFF